MTRVAVLGAGFQGTCVALELALRGVEVDLYDCNDRCITQAGYANEGKVHLGFVYANDRTFDTAKLMARGALAFGRAVYRWTACDIATIGVSTPFDYVVHRTTMVSTESIAGHFAKVDKFARELMAATGHAYLGINQREPFFRLSPEKLGSLYDPDVAAAVFETSERSLNAKQLANILRKRIADEPRVTFTPRSQVTEITHAAVGYEVSCVIDGIPVREMYQQVVNCLCDGKLKLEDPVFKWIPEWREDERKDITIFHLVHMISGLSGKALTVLNKDDRDADRLTLVLQQPLLYPPGTRYQYNGFAYDCLSTLVRKASGMEAAELLRRRVFEPIGMQHATFGFYQGKTEPSGLMHISARDGARFGYLFLRNGKWNGKQIVSSDWVRRVSRTSNNVNPYCSYLWWVNTPGYADAKSIPPEIAVNEHGWKDLPGDTFSTFGHYGNSITVLPSQDLVVVRLIGVGKVDLSPNDHCKLILGSIVGP